MIPQAHEQKVPLGPFIKRERLLTGVGKVWWAWWSGGVGLARCGRCGQCGHTNIAPPCITILPNRPPLVTKVDQSSHKVIVTMNLRLSQNFPQLWVSLLVARKLGPTPKIWGPAACPRTCHGPPCPVCWAPHPSATLSSRDLPRAHSPAHTAAHSGPCAQSYARFRVSVTRGVRM